MSRVREMTSRTWLIAALILVGTALYMLQRVLIPFVLAAGLAYIFKPLVNWVERRTRLPRPAIVALFYVLTLGPLLTAGYLFGPLLMDKAQTFLNEIPASTHRLVVELLGGDEVTIMNRGIDAEAVTQAILKRAKETIATPGGVVRLGSNAIEIFIGALLTLVVLFYLMASRNLFLRTVLLFTPEGQQSRAELVLQKINFLLGRYLRGVLLVVLYAFTTSFLGLKFLFHLPYSAIVALLTGILEIVPGLGPILSLVLACFAALLSGGFWLLLKVGIFYGLLRLSLDNILGPIILGRAALIHPVMVIFAFLVGGTLFGVPGLLLAVPVTATIRLMAANWEDFFGE